MYPILVKISPRVRTLFNPRWKAPTCWTYIRERFCDNTKDDGLKNTPGWQIDNIAHKLSAKLNRKPAFSLYIHKIIQQSSGRRKDTKYNLPVKNAKRLAKLLIPKISDMDRFPVSRTNDCQGLSFTEFKFWRPWLCRFQELSNLPAPVPRI